MDSSPTSTSLLATYCPQGVFTNYRYINPNEEGHTLKMFRLQRHYEEMVDSFQQLVTQAVCTVRYKNVEHRTLLAFLEKIEATRPHPEDDLVKQLLFEKLLTALKASESIEDLFDLTEPHFTAFTYHVLTDILVEYGDTSTKHLYVSKLNYYNQRPITSAPRVLIAPRAHGFTFVRMYVSWNPSQRSLHELEAFRLAASSTLKLTHYPLILIGVEMLGSVMVIVYQLPEFLKELILPLDAKQKSVLMGKNVLRVEVSGQAELTKSGEEIYEDLLKKEMDFWGTANDDNDFVTPPTTPPPSITTLPSIGAEEAYTLEPSQAGITSHHFQLIKQGFERRNFIAFVPETSDNSKLMAMLMCQHIEAMVSAMNFPKMVVVANSYRRALQIHEELKKLLPLAKIKCITGREDNASISGEFNFTDTTTTVVTAGRLLGEIQDGKTTFKPITLLLLDDCSGMSHETSLEDLVQCYVEARRHERLPRDSVQIAAFTSQPGSGLFALSERSMQDHLIKMCGLLEANGGFIVTPKVRSKMFTRADPVVSVEEHTLHVRWPLNDVTALLCVEMGWVERLVGVVYTLERWNQHYREFIKNKRSTLPQDSPDRERSLAFFDLLPIYSRAVEICKRQSPKDVGRYLIENRPKTDDIISPSVAEVYKSYDCLCKEYDDIIKYEVPLETKVAHILSEKFSENHSWRGYLFIDSRKDPQKMANEITDNVRHIRPTILSSKFISVSKLNKKRKDLDIIQGFEREGSRLIITQFEIEKFDDITQIDLPKCNFIVRLQQQYNEQTRHMQEEEYTLTFVSCPKRKSCQELCQNLQSILLERAVTSMPQFEGDEFKGRMLVQQRNAMREYTNRNAGVRRAISRRKPSSKKVPQIHQIALRCKKCKVYVCHGNQIFMLFIDGARNYIVPHYEFRQRISVKRFRPVRKVPKQINRLKKMYCNSCNSEWGHICFFPKRGLEFPVLRAKHFLFEIRNSLQKVKMWPDVSFYVPSLGACSKYLGEDSDPE